MIAYRAALAVAACLTGLSLAACSGGLTTASPPVSSPSSAPTAPASSAPAAPTGGVPAGSAPTGSGNVTGAGTTVSVAGSLGTFPIPPGAQVVENGTSGNQIDIMLGGVTPAVLDSFYTTALPQAGFTITSNTLATVVGVTAGGIDFTGHGYKGSIGDVNGTIGITLTPQ